MAIPAYAELWCRSNFSFLTGASHAEELARRAARLGYTALAVTDDCSMAGVVRAHVAAKDAGLKLILGAQFEAHYQAEGQAGVCTVIVLARNREGYGNLCELITKLRRASPKGTYHLDLDSLVASTLADCLVLAAPARRATQQQLDAVAGWLQAQFAGRCWFAVEQVRQLGDEMWLHRLREVGERWCIPLVAAGNVHMHVRSRKPVQDVLASIRHGKPLTEMGRALKPNAEHHLRSRLRLSQIFASELLEETLQIAARCEFRLDELRYEYPDEVVPEGHTPTSYLRRLTYEGAGRRWPQGIPENVESLITHELDLIAELGYERYFLTVADLVIFARSRGILCQGRGSAANSAVCYALGITEVDPARTKMLFERFISRERFDEPDIDVDFEHSRREEVIQHIYSKYGRNRAALTATVISYRPRSVIRDVGKALGMSKEVVDMLATAHQWWDGSDVLTEHFEEAGLSMDGLQVRQLIEIARTLLSFPRHLGQHTGGFVLTRGPLARMVPIENASMADRTIIQWDKDDLDAMGLLKVDVLALGMLTAIRRALEFVSLRKGFEFTMQDIPAEDPTTYDMMCAAQTVGVFQIESRAQMSMLPRMQPRCFHDIVVQVAIVRPGPIQGGAVHPYLARREGREEVTYPSPAVEAILGSTLGIPLFQEQCMELAIECAGFTGGEADELRRGMAAWKRNGSLAKFQPRIMKGMQDRGYTESFAQNVFEQMKGFTGYGFPRSHAASFGLLVYASSWLKCHHQPEFLAALLNSQPMGFYPPSQLVQDAIRRGVEVRRVDVMLSDVDCTLEGLPHPPAVRLGLRLIAGLSSAAAQRIIDARSEALFESAEDLARRAGLEQHEMRILAAADALMSLAGHRRQQVWEASALRSVPKFLEEVRFDEEPLEMAPAPEAEEVVFDYASTGLTLRSHPVSFLRERFERHRLMSAAQLAKVPDGRVVRYCGLVTVRQAPGTANGTTFVSLEDETGTVQIICWESVRERQRAALLDSRLLAVKGRWQRRGQVCNIIAERLVDLSHLLGRLGTASRDFH